MRQLSSASVLAVSTLLAIPASAVLPSRDVSKTLPLAAGESVRVDTYKGSVDVHDMGQGRGRRRGPDRGRRLAAGTTKDAARWVDQTRVVIEKRHGGVSITSDYDALEEATSWFGSCTARPFVRYTISMPRSAPLRIKDYKSDLIVKELAADLDVNTYKGHLDVAGLAGGLKVETYKGEVNAGIVRLSGDVNAETYKGSIVLHLPGGGGFELSAESGARRT